MSTSDHDEDDLPAYIPPVSGLTAREQRISAARKASSSYTAKLEPAGWFNTPSTVSSAKNTFRCDLYALTQLYLQREYMQVMKKGFVMAKGEGRTIVGTEDAEVLDLVMRSALRSRMEPTEELVVLARRYIEHKLLPSLALTSSQLMQRAPPSLLLHPNEPIEAILTSIAVSWSSQPYTAQLSSLLLPTSPLLASIIDNKLLRSTSSREEMVREIKALELSEKGRKVLERAVRLDERDEEVEVEELVRDVRNL